MIYALQNRLKITKIGGEIGKTLTKTTDNFMFWREFALKNIARMQNCPDITILNSLSGRFLNFCLSVFFLLVFLSFPLFYIYIYIYIKMC